VAAKINSKRVKLIKATLSHGNDEYHCCFCLKTFFLEFLTIEHIIPKTLGGTNQLINLALSCTKCNNDRDCSNFSEYRDYKTGLIKKKPMGSLGNRTESPKKP